MGRGVVVHLDCGCTVVVEHDLGERLVHCPDHNIEHVVTAQPTRHVYFRSRRRVQLLDEPAVAS